MLVGLLMMEFCLVVSFRAWLLLAKMKRHFGNHHLRQHLPPKDPCPLPPTLVRLPPAAATSTNLSTFVCTKTQHGQISVTAPVPQS